MHQYFSQWNLAEIDAMHGLELFMEDEEEDEEEEYGTISDNVHISLDSLGMSESDFM